MRTLKEILDSTPASLENGLSPEAAAKSRERFGDNRLTPLAKEPIWKKFLEKFDEPIIKILLAAALLSMIVESFNAGVNAADPAEKATLLWAAGLSLGGLIAAVAAAFALKAGEWLPSVLFGSAIVIFGIGAAVGHPSYEGLAVMIAIVLATGVAFLNEFKSDQEFEALNARKESIQVKVTRGGQLVTIPMDDVVVGDLVTLEMGDEIPADGRVVKATDLMVDQSLMTGESEPVKKRAGKPDDAGDTPAEPSAVFRATQVVEGVGQFVVTEVGDGTYLGRIAAKLKGGGGDEEDDGAAAADSEDVRIKKKLSVSKALTPLQVKLQHLAETISMVGYFAAGAIFIALLVLGAVQGKLFVPTDGPGALAVGQYVLSAFMYMVIVIVVAVPEGLPMSVTVSLALAMQKMTKANSLVRQLVACETIGSATVIASDKTGTLTQNKMQVVRLGLDGKVFDHGTPEWVKPDPDAGWPRAGLPINWVALNAAVNSTAHLEEKEGKVLPVGNSTEASLLQWLRDSGLDYRKLRLQFEPLYQIHFSSERKRMTSVVRYGDRIVTLVKGAPEYVLDQCGRYAAGDGTAHELTAEARENIKAQLKDAAGHAMRTLGFAYAVLPDGVPTDADGLHECKEKLEEGLIFAGFCAIRDPLRDDVPEAVRKCRQAGIEVKMVTGDNIETAKAIGKQIGLLDRPDAVVLTGPEFKAKTDEELLAVLPKMTILSRAQPLDKYRLVRLLQQLNHVVAVTGDGTNDAPALKTADVGLSMGKAGTEVAKEASKIVLLDDSFATIVRAVHWGRALYENIQRFIQFQLTINVSALTIAFLGPFFGVKPPFTVLQLLWINVIMDTFAAIALCSEPPREGLMKVAPKKKDENILTPGMLGNIFTTAAFFVVVMMGLLLAMERPPVEGGNWLLNLLGRPEGIGLFAGEGDLAQPTKDFPELTYHQATIFFTVYVFFQVWNQINCRSLVPEESGLKNLFGNPTFLGIASLTLIGQIIIVTFGYDIFQVRPLGVLEWLAIAGATSSVLLFAELARRFRSTKPASGEPAAPQGIPAPQAQG
jgi:Ca2+-transporting ATPase